jgi:anti-anti-sigma factor
VDLDFHDLQYISSLGLGILSAHTEAPGRVRGHPALGPGLTHIREIFRFSGFDRIFPIEEEASEQAR